MFGRRPSAEDDDQVVDDVAIDEPVGKGRPTPKRSEAEAARKKRMSPPKNRKEASVMRRERMREAKLKQRQAMAGGGDDRYLPARDQGPVKKFIRDWVDARRTFLEMLFPVFVGFFIIALFLPAAVQSYIWVVWLLILVALLFDSLRIRRGVMRAVAEHFGADQTRGITMYALMRSCQIRRMRLPKPSGKTTARF